MKRLKKTGSKTNLQFKPRQTLFWDVNPKTIDPQKHAKYVIERIMDFGKDNEVRWMVHYYSPQQIKKVVQTSRGVLHDKTKALWQLIYP